MTESPPWQQGPSKRILRAVEQAASFARGGSGAVSSNINALKAFDDPASASMRLWSAKAGLEAYLVFEAQALGLLNPAPLARIIVKTTKRTVSIAVHYRSGGQMRAHFGRTTLGAMPVTFLLHGIKIGDCTIEWRRGAQAWNTQLKEAGLKVIKVL